MLAMRRVVVSPGRGRCGYDGGADLATTRTGGDDGDETDVALGCTGAAGDR